MNKLFVSIIFFIIALYMVEASPIGDMAVAKYNQGYGAFDMKNYDETIVKEVLGKMEEKGFQVYKLYYAADTVFLIAFGILQILLLQVVFKWVKEPKILLLLFAVPIMRGLADILENTILCVTLFQYPIIQAEWIKIASVATKIKLLCIRLWGCEMVVGIAGRFLTSGVVKHTKLR